MLSIFWFEHIDHTVCVLVGLKPKHSFTIAGHYIYDACSLATVAREELDYILSVLVCHKAHSGVRMLDCTHARKLDGYT